MLRYLIGRGIDAQERKAGVPLDYARHILRTSVGAFARYALTMPMATHRSRIGAAESFTAKLVATRHEDCGSCVQIVVNLARRAGVSREILTAVIAARPESLPRDVRDVYHFADAITSGEGDASELRERIRTRYGEEGLVDLALAIASARVFPTTKRVSGTR